MLDIVVSEIYVTVFKYIIHLSIIKVNYVKVIYFSNSTLIAFFILSTQE